MPAGVRDIEALREAVQVAGGDEWPFSVVPVQITASSEEKACLATRDVEAGELLLHIAPSLFFTPKDACRQVMRWAGEGSVVCEEGCLSVLALINIHIFLFGPPCLGSRRGWQRRGVKFHGEHGTLFVGMQAQQIRHPRGILPVAAVRPQSHACVLRR